MKRHNSVGALLLSTLLVALTACSGAAIEPTRIAAALEWAHASEATGAATLETSHNLPVTPSTVSVEFDSDDLVSGEAGSDVSYIRLEGSIITFVGSGATVNDSVVTITSAGMYSISGILDDGQIVVNTEDKETVGLILNGVDITCSTSAPIHVMNADKTVITLADGTENTVIDGVAYILEDATSDEPNAAVFSKDDLTIKGNGSLTVNANYNNGIASKYDLKITGGRITVTAANDGIKGKDSVAIKDGIIIVNAGGDGIQSHNEVDPEKGFISIEGGTLNITAELDGIQAETNLFISGGQITISSGGGSVGSAGQSSRRGWGMWSYTNDNSEAQSTKGLKAGVDVTISGGTFHIDSLDDSIHSNDSLTIGGGEFVLSSGDDAMHSDSTLVINGGAIEIISSYEGIESATITINDGTIRIVASDDGINASSGTGGLMTGGRPGQPNMGTAGNNRLNVHGGYVVVDANGDGLDINGPINMSGGVLIINGPTANDNGALDYTGVCEITGGYLVAVGSAGMAQAPSTSSTQHSLVVALAQSANTMVHIETQDGDAVLTFAPTKTYQLVVFSSPELENGTTYVVYTGGRSTGTVTDGLYTGGTYTGGNQITSLTMSSMITVGGAFGGGGFTGGFGRTGRQRP